MGSPCSAFEAVRRCALTVAILGLAACTGTATSGAGLDAGADAGVRGDSGSAARDAGPHGSGDGAVGADDSGTAPGGDGGTADGGADAGAYRAFTDTSYWNTPMPVDAPLDPNETLYLADAMDTSVSTPWLGLTGAPGASQAFASPVYWAAASDTVYTVTPALYGPTVDIRIPAGATPQSGSDGELLVFDLTGDMAIGLWQAVYDATSDSWSASGTDRYVLSSNGLDHHAAGSDDMRNRGHRGVPGPVRQVRLDEVRAGAIRHRLECYWHATGRPNATSPWYYWPMVGYEPGRGGVVPEGTVIRIRPDVDLSTRSLSPAARIIARALQQYGCVIGDNSGGTHNRLKLERDEAAWAALDPALNGDSLSDLPWSDWEFIQGGYAP